MQICPCGSGSSFDECCGPILRGTPAATAQALMRSRYSAFVLSDFDHLENSLAPETRDQFNRSAAEAMANGVEWLGLEVRTVTDGGVEDQTGAVEFVARFKEDGAEYAARVEITDPRLDRSVIEALDEMVQGQPAVPHRRSLRSAEAALALQLPFRFEVGSLSDRLMSSTPE